MNDYRFFLDRLSSLGRVEISCYGYGQFWYLRRHTNFNPCEESEKLRSQLINRTLEDPATPAILYDENGILFAAILWESSPIYEYDGDQEVSRMPTEEEKKDRNRWVWFFIGPCALHTMNKVELHRCYRTYTDRKVAEKHPPVLSFERFLSMVQLAAMTLDKKTDEEVLIEKNHLNADIHTGLSEDQIRFSMRQEEEEAAHHSYAEEQAMLAYIKEGDEKNALALNMKLDQEAGIISKNELMQVRKTLVAAITLITRAAIEGGMMPAEAYALSDYYLVKSDDCKDIPALIGCRNEAVLDFCRRIREQKDRNTYSYYVTQTCDYVGKHYREKFSLTKMAEQLGITPSYLSKLFKREMNQTLEDYITGVRIERASNLLRFSDQPVSTIGDYVGFGTQSYFCSTFKKLTGLTPGQYRKQFSTR